MKLAESLIQVPEFCVRLRGRILAVVLLMLTSAGAVLGQQIPTLEITTLTLPGGIVGAAYAPQALTAKGGTSPYGSAGSTCTPPSGSRWCLVAGSLPAGLVLSTVGIISGTPSGPAGTASFVVELRDSGTSAVQQSLSITVTTPLSVTTASLPDAIVGTSYAPQPLVTAGGTLPNTWTVIAGALPPNMNLSSAGTISGTPGASGRYSFTVRATDSGNPPQTATKVLSIAVPPFITSSPPNGAIGLGYAHLMAVSPGNAPFNWTLTSGTLPPGISLSLEGRLSGTPTTTGAFPFVLTVTDSSTPPLTTAKDFTITIQPSLVITTGSTLPAGIVSVFYSQQLAASGPPPLTWSIVSGTLPPGLQITPTGSLVGTPSIAQTFGFVLQAAGGNPVQTVQQSFTLTIHSALDISTTSPLPSASLTGAYSTTLTATGGVPPYTWSIAGTSTLPPGLTLSTSGLLSGTPTRAGSFSLGIQVSDSFVPTQQVLRNFTLTVSTALSIVTNSLPNGEINKVYPNLTLSAGAGTPIYTWSVSAGSLPSGMTLASDGTLGGTPLVSGTFDFTARVDDSSTPVQNATKALTLIIQPTLAITTTSPLPIAVAGVFYSKQISVTSTQTSFSWATISGGLPPGINLAQTGLLVGTPQVEGTFDFTVRVSGTNPVQTVEQAFRMVVNGALNISTIATLPDATLGVDYSLTLVASGGLPPYTWTNPGRTLPTGLSLSPSGIISGVPSGVGTFSFTLQVSDSFSPVQSTLRTFVFSVNSGISITTLLLPNANQNLAYDQTFQAVGGLGPLTWVVSGGTLPAGLILGTNGVIQGIPTGIESKSIVVTVTDARGISDSKNFTFTVDPPIPALSSPGLPASLNPTQSSPLRLSLATPLPSSLSGTLTLSFVSKAEVAGNDPMTQFSTGSRTVTFTIPANATAADFPSAVSLLPGTVAGTITLTVTLDNSPSIVLPVSTVEIAPTAPQMTNVTALRTSSGLEVQITGYSATRRVANAEFIFDVKGSKVQQVTLKKDVDAEFSAWYRNPNALAFGSAFSFVQTFDVVGGDTSFIQSVTVRLTNPQGSTESQVIPFK